MIKLRITTLRTGMGETRNGVRKVYKRIFEISMVVQWLRLHTANAAVTSWISDQETKISHAMWQHQKIKKDFQILPFISISQILLVGHFMIMLNNLCKWRWKPTPVFLPGKFHGQRSLMGYSPWDRKDYRL